MENNITKVGLNRMISLLRNHLSGFSFREFPLGEDTARTYYTVLDIQLIAARMCKHMALIGYTPVVTFEPLTEAAGEINLNSDLNIFINIDSSKQYSWQQVLCILAHELSHKFLYVHFIRFEGMKNELLTDCCAVYTGFGQFMVNGCYTVRTQGNTKHTSRIGYLQQWQLNYLHYQLFGYYILNPLQCDGQFRPEDFQPHADQSQQNQSQQNTQQEQRTNQEHNSQQDQKHHTEGPKKKHARPQPPQPTPQDVAFEEIPGAKPSPLVWRPSIKQRLTRFVDNHMAATAILAFLSLAGLLLLALRILVNIYHPY